jgi:acetoacetyl-CoA synthetase
MTVNGSAKPHEVSAEAKELWRHSNPQSTQIYDFMQGLNQKYQLSLQNYNDLWQWSISRPSEFWEEIWHYTNIKAHKQYGRVSSSTPKYLDRPRLHIRDIVPLVKAQKY